MILVMGGIHEAKQIYDALLGMGMDAMLTVATRLGEAQYAGSRLERYTVESLVRAAREHGFHMIVNATHPHAAEASRTARAAAAELGIPLLRFERPQSELQLPPNARSFADFRSALADCAVEIGNGRLLVTGVKHIADCLDFIPKEQLYIRLMPSSYSIAECERFGIPLGNMIAIKTPVSLSMNHAIFREFRITDFMFKASGEGSATASNLRAIRPEESCDSRDAGTWGNAASPSPAVSSPAVRGWIVAPPAEHESSGAEGGGLRFSSVDRLIGYISRV